MIFNDTICIRRRVRLRYFIAQGVFIIYVYVDVHVFF